MSRHDEKTSHQKNVSLEQLRLPKVQNYRTGKESASDASAKMSLNANTRPARDWGEYNPRYIAVTTEWTTLRSFKSLTTTTLIIGNGTYYEMQKSMEEFQGQLSSYRRGRWNGNICTRLRGRNVFHYVFSKTVAFISSWHLSYRPQVYSLLCGGSEV